MSAIKFTMDTPQLADDYQKVNKQNQNELGRILLDRLQLEAGQTVVDVGCGTGENLLDARSVVGSRGTLIGIDPLPLRIAKAKAEAENRGYENVTFSVDTAENLTVVLGPTRVDTIYFNSVLHWIPQQNRLGVLRSAYEALDQGGKIGISGGSGAHPHPLDARRAALSREPHAQYGMGAIAELETQESLRTRLRASGFAADRIRVDTYEDVVKFPNVAAMLAYLRTSSFGTLDDMSHLPPDLQEQARADTVAEYGKLGSGPIEQSITMLLAIATKM